MYTIFTIFRFGISTAPNTAFPRQLSSRRGNDPVQGLRSFSCMVICSRQCASLALFRVVRCWIPIKRGLHSFIHGEMSSCWLSKAALIISSTLNPARCLTNQGLVPLFLSTARRHVLRMSRKCCQERSMTAKKQPRHHD